MRVVGLSLVACLLIPWLALAAPEAPKPVPQVVIETPTHRLATFTVELAQSEAEHARGLMGRASLAPDAGMLFLFSRDDVKAFWMKNTLISLDMLFIDAHGTVVGLIENAEPLTTTTRAVAAASRDVLEVAGGTCARLGITSGSRVRFSAVPGRPLP